MTKSKTIFGALLFGAFAWASCSDNDAGSVSKFDPSLPMTITDFYPDSGGIATPMIISGKNFGADTTGLAVNFIDEDGVAHKGGLVSSNGEKLYCYVPAGLTYKRDIKLEVTRANGNDTIVGAADRNFKYITQTAVTTIIGTQTENAHPTKGGKLLTADLSAPSFLCIDPKNNIFIVERLWSAPAPVKNMRCLNEKNEGTYGMVLQADLNKGEVSVLYDNKSTPINAPAYSTLEGYEGVYVPDDGGRKYYSLLKDQDYAVKVNQFINPSDYKDLDNRNYKYCFVINKNDQKIYTVMYHGELVRIDPRTRKAEVLLKRVGKDNGFTGDGGGNDNYCTFSPIQPNRLFISQAQCSEIWYVDIDQLDNKDPQTYNGEPYAGVAAYGTVNWSEGMGWEDGPLKNAKFKLPRQLTFTKDGKLYIADSGNHCIRVIDTTLGANARVTTPIGIPGSAGYADGGVELAKFNSPTGVAVSADGSTVYVADMGNQVIRELSIK